MKQLLYSLSFLIFISLMAGCMGNESGDSISFYYPRADYGYNSHESIFFDSAIMQEARTDIPYQSPSQVIGIYLKGPEGTELANPFPEGTTLKAISIYQGTLKISVSDHLSELTGIDLVIACACLARTGMELTDTTSVQILCENTLLDGKKSVTFDLNTVIFEDPPVVTTAAEE